MKTIDNRGINMHKVSLLNTFSREFVNTVDPNIEDEINKLHEIDKLKTYPKWIYLLSTGIGSAFCAAMLGGNQVSTFILTVLTSILAIFIFDKTLKYSSISMFATMLASSVITICGVIFHKFNMIPDASYLIVGSIMPLLPGVAFIKCMRDLISGSLMSGAARIFEVFIILAAIASGVALVIGIGGV